ncbi:MAG: hypothetical protein JST54_23680 [Deltaproteobacteria bacterium]|nr:hypothetical protein [Deltaproteobacteria bacterium]
MLDKFQVNLDFVRASALLLEGGGTGRVVVSVGDAQRTAHVVRGYFVHATSNLPKDRIGDMLVAEKRLDPDLLEPIAAEAERLGLLFGDLLIIDGLLTPVELAEFLERQALARFERMMLMKGAVRVEQAAPGRPTTRRSVAALVMGLFREKVPFEAAESLALERLRNAGTTAPRMQRVRDANLSTHERVLCKLLDGGASFQKVFDGLDPATEDFQRGVRFLAALEALGVFASD